MTSIVPAASRTYGTTCLVPPLWKWYGDMAEMRFYDTAFDSSMQLQLAQELKTRWTI